METDIQTQNHAAVIAREYNLADVENLKTERILTPGTSINSLWLATGDRNIRCFVQYDSDAMPKLE